MNPFVVSTYSSDGEDFHMLFLAHSVSRHGSELTYAHFERRESRVERTFLFLNFGRVGRAKTACMSRDCKSCSSSEPGLQLSNC